MQLAAIDLNENLAALAARVYDLGEKPTSADTKAATKALVDANPFLRQIAAVPVGTVIDVPPLPTAESAPGATRTEQATAADLVVDRVRAAVALAQRQLFADIEAETQDAQGAIRTARSPALKKLRSATPALGDALPRTIAMAEARVSAAEALRGQQGVVCEQIVKDLTELTQAFAEVQRAG